MSVGDLARESISWSPGLFVSWLENDLASKVGGQPPQSSVWWLVNHSVTEFVRLIMSRLESSFGGGLVNPL